MSESEGKKGKEGKGEGGREKGEGRKEEIKQNNNE